MGILHHLLGQGDIVLEGLGGRINHDGSESAVNTGFAEFEAVAVIQVQRNGNLRVLYHSRLH